MEAARHLTILLAEDDENHVLIIQKAFELVPELDYEMRVIYDGETLLAFMNSPSEPLPDLLLLDLKLPRCDGFEILKEIRQNDRSRHLPVIVLTSSARASDVFRCYELGANSYIVKPMKFDKFKEIIFYLCQYWFGVCRLPSQIDLFDN